METGRSGKIALVLTALAALAAVAVAVLAADLVPRIIAAAAAVFAIAGAVLVARSDGAAAARLRTLDDERAAAQTALAAERKRAESVLALGPAVDEVLERQSRVAAAIETQERAANDTRGAAGDAVSGAHAAGDSVGSLARSVVDSSAAIEEMVSSIRLVSDNIGGLADTVNSVSSAIGELAASISQVAGNAQEANTLSMQADSKARDGGKAVERLVESTREIAVDIHTVVKKMEELGDASTRIGDIIEVIDNIADQTNLLALNAAIEAARAGEHGRGFAVVADEVRKLAENSASSTKEIGKLVKDIQAKTDEVVRSTTASGTKAESGLQMADLAGRAIADILGAVAEASRLIEQISTAAKEQALGSSAIVNSVEQMNLLMREAARSLDEQNTSNQQMIATITAMQRLTDTVSAAVARQRAAIEKIDEAARKLAEAGNAGRDAAAASEAGTRTLREKVLAIVHDVHPPRGQELGRADGRARLGAGR